jgi:PEGA domain
VSILPPRSYLSISANEPAEVWLDGEPVGQTPLLDLPADVGTREVRLRNAAGVERRRTIIVTVAPVTVDVDFSAP